MSLVRYRSLPGIKAAELSEPSAADLALISGTFSRGVVTAEDVHVRQARVAHNQHDRTGERFPKAYLERFAETLPGKSVLPGHDKGALPLGRWFRAETRTRQEEFPVMVREGLAPRKDAGKAAEIIPGFKAENLRVTWLESAFYFANAPETEGFRKNLDLGVYQDVSIGFSYDDLDCDICKASYFKECPHYRGQRLEDGRLVTLTYSGDPKQVEAMETSIVYLGAQQHAELMKSLRTGTVDPKALAATPLGEDLAVLKEAEAYARLYGHAQKSWAFPGIELSASDDAEPEPSLGGEKEHTQAEPAVAPAKENPMKERLIKALSLPETATDDEVVAAVEKSATAAKSLESAGDLAALKAAAEEAKTLKPLAKTGETYLADLKTAILDDELRLTGKTEPSAELADLVEMHVQAGNHERLKTIAAQKREAVEQKFPTGRHGNPNVGQEEGEKKDDAAARKNGRIPHSSEFSVI